MRVTLLASDLGATGAGARAAALATHLPAPAAVTLLALAAGPSTALAHLARHGVPYRVFPVRGAFDVRGLLRLRAAVRASRPDVLHAVGRRAESLPWFALAPGVRVTVTDLIAGPVVLPAPDGPPADFAAFGVPPGSRVILAAGGFDRAADLRTAVWAFDVLKYTAPDWHLVLAGDGPLRADCERFARQVGGGDVRVHFAGVRDDLPRLMRSAYAVWVTHRAEGATTAVEALAAGVPVLGFDRTEVWRAAGGAAVLVPPGDPVALSAATYNLAPDPARTAAGLRRAADYSAAAVAERVAAAYDAFPAAPPPAGTQTRSGA